MWELTQLVCERLDNELDGVGCIISRVIGDVLVQVAEHAPDGRTFQLGRGFLVSQFPVTAEVLATGVPASVEISGPEPDAAEVGVLRDLGVEAVLMLALRGDAEAWGLVECYRSGHDAFSTSEVERAQSIVAAAEERLRVLVRSRA